MALLKGASKVRNDLIFLANDILMNIKPLSPYFIAVNKVGKSDRNNLAQITQAYSSGKCVLIFPSGYVSRKIEGQITDLDWQKSVVVKCRQNNLPLVPVFIDGRNTERFYRISTIRKIFGIKVNFEMFTLPDEMFKARGKDIHIYFGKPITPDKLAQGNPFEIAQKIKKIVYLLKGNLLTEY
jgi:putative hemolysin